MTLTIKFLSKNLSERAILKIRLINKQTGIDTFPIPKDKIRMSLLKIQLESLSKIKFILILTLRKLQHKKRSIAVVDMEENALHVNQFIMRVNFIKRLILCLGTKTIQ